MTLDELKTWLPTVGFRVCDDNFPRGGATWYAAKRSTIPARVCETNKDKPGFQIVVQPHYYHTVHESVTVEVRGEASGIWWAMQAYPLNPVEVRDRLVEIEASLVAAWNALR